MDPATIISALEAAVQAAMQLYSDYQTGKQVLAETDVAKIHANLKAAEAVTASLRQQVDAALSAAAKQ